MRLYEFNGAAAQLAALSSLIKGRIDDTASESPGIKVDAFIKLAKNMGISINRTTLTDLIATPPLSNLISGVENDTVNFIGPNSTEVESPRDKQSSKDRVETMAKRQLKK